MTTRESLIPLYLEYINSGGVISPMNTETCRKHLQKQSGTKVESEDILWLFYHIKNGGREDAECY